MKCYAACMKLLLTASGIVNPELERAFLELTGSRQGLAIAYIRTGGDPIEWVLEYEGSKKYVAKLKELTEDERVKGENWLLSYKAKHEEKGHKVVVVDLKDDPEQVRKVLESVDVIEVGGGDINYLLSWAKKSKLDTYLKGILDRGVVYLGTSAGSMLPQPDIGLTWWDPITMEDEDHVGLGLVNFIACGNHDTDSADASAVDAVMQKMTERRDMLRSHMPYLWTIYVIFDGQAVKVDGNSIEHIGPGIKKSI